MLGSTIPVSIIGTKFAMSVTPFWTPIQYSSSHPSLDQSRPIQRFPSSHCWYALWGDDLRGRCRRGLRVERAGVRDCYPRRPTWLGSNWCRENRDKIEIYLSFGATRMEACRPIVIEALRLALTPPINNMRYAEAARFLLFSPLSSTNRQRARHYCNTRDDDRRHPWWFLRPPSSEAPDDYYVYDHSKHNSRVHIDLFRSDFRHS